MNPEVPPIPESDNPESNSPQSLEQLEQLDLDELEVESTSETISDSWLDEDIIDVVVDSQATDSQFNNSQLDTKEESEPKSEELEPDTELNSSSREDLNTERIAEVLEVGNLNAIDIDVVLENISSESEPESSGEAELFVDSWLDEPDPDTSAIDRDTDGNLEESNIENSSAVAPQDDEVNQLEQQKATLQGEIVALKAQKEQILSTQIVEIQEIFKRTVEEGTQELRERKTALEIEVEKLERRKERINQEMRANFAGSSQELAIKVQGFKNYLVGSLQDLARAADKLELAKEVPARSKSRSSQTDTEDGWGIARGGDSRASRDRDNRGSRGARDSRERSSRDNRDSRSSRGGDSRGNRGSRSSTDPNSAPIAPQGQFSEPTFADQGRRIRQLIDRYRNNPDYYGSPWQLRRTFEPIHAKKVQDWFFVQGGRGAVDSMGSRLQNILVASATVSILHSLYGDRCRVLVLTDTPENLGEWRRGLQDCLGISRSNFGSNRGVTLFDAPEVVVQRAERLIADKLLPVIIIDETEELLNLSVLKFPLWIAFASTAKPTSSNYLY